jgi:hypothetical protein
VLGQIAHPLQIRRDVQRRAASMSAVNSAVVALRIAARTASAIVTSRRLTSLRSA